MLKSARSRDRAIGVATYLACIILLTWPAIFNGYPILYSDTASYVASGMRLEMPTDRPLTYGLFIRITSIGGFTLWTTIASQAALLVRLIELLLLRVSGKHEYHRVILITLVGLLAFLTSAPWIVSQVMADIFTPMLVLCCAVLFIPPREPAKRTHRILLYALFFLCVAAHLSHPVLIGILCISMLLLRWVMQRWVGTRTPQRPIWAMLGLAALAYPIMSSATGKSAGIFYMGALVEHGVAKTYLDEHCATETYKLCAWKDRLPERAYQFHWDMNGPIGAYPGRQEANEEFGRIIAGMRSEPEFIRMQIIVSLRAAWKQLGMFAIGDGWGPFTEGTGVYYILSRHMRHDMGAMTTSRQYAGNMQWIQPFIWIHAWCVRVCLIALIPFTFMAARKGRKAFLPFVVIIFLGIVVSAWGSGTFSGEVDRFGCKMIWTIPFAFMLGVAALLPGERAGNQ